MKGCSRLVGASRLNGIPYGFADFFFSFFFSSAALSTCSKKHSLNPHIVNISDRAEILLKHAYCKSAGTVKKWFG